MVHDDERLRREAEALFRTAADGFGRAAGGGRYDSYFAGQLHALEQLGLIETARVRAVLRPGAHALCGCWF